MSFATDLYAVMIGDASINTEIDGGIHYENLPDNFDLTKKWIVYHYNGREQIDCMKGSKLYEIKDLNVTLITQNTEDLTSISELIKDYLNFTEYGTIMDINFTGDGHTFDQEKNIYMNTLNFDVMNI